MGWTFFHKPRGLKAIDAIKRECGENWWAEHVVAASATFEAVHIVSKRHAPESDVYVPDADGMIREIGVFKIQNVPKARDGYNFGYKDMSESMGPYGCECAPSIIEAASPLKPLPAVVPDYSSLKSAHEYRARSLTKAKAKAAKRALKVGAKLKLAQPLSFGGVMLDEFVVERCRVRGRKGISTVFRSTVTGSLCNLSAMNLIGATEETK
jgi:hypothetical protein